MTQKMKDIIKDPKYLKALKIIEKAFKDAIKAKIHY